ncbi:MAG: hypothetical protein Q8N39_05070 [Pelolinea sp.]|nr:hypothetical protein [Pelolinea sp.]
METKKSLRQIPSSVKPFFQEYDFTRLNIRQHKTLLMERILALGNRQEIQWLIQTFGKPAIRDWLAQSGEKRLPWRRFHLWCLLFGLLEPEKPQRIWTR